ncbi:MAG: hypothetical protein Q9197_001577 [Variospora fuerteventurae]
MASLLSRATLRQKQLADAFNLTPLFEIPYQIIGQRLAARTLQQRLLGHGKTELAKCMGDLLSLPFLKIDCTHLGQETDLSGAPAPYQGWEDGSRLDNFLTNWTGQKAVVFLDGFDKMNHENEQSRPSNSCVRFSNESRKSLNAQEKQSARHIFLNYVNDGQLAVHIAETYDSSELGARSLLKGVSNLTLHKLTSAFLETEKEIVVEMNGKPLERYDVQLEELKGGIKHVTDKSQRYQECAEARPCHPGALKSKKRSSKTASDATARLIL